MYSDRAEAREWDPSLPGIKWSAAHNSFLQAAAEMGIPGILLFCALVFGSFLQCIMIRRRLPPNWYKGDHEERFLYYTSVYLPVAMIGFAVGGFFVSFAYMDLVYVLGAFVAGLQVSVDVKLGVSPQPVSRTAPRRGRGRLRQGVPAPQIMPQQPK
jgi:O-antigen ligase